MTYKGYRIDRKCNVFDLNNELIIEKAGNVVIAKEMIDNHLEEQHKAADKKKEKKNA